ncbi:hypothetical protein PAHAL_3G266900 [Panicum hallii]|jgi:hypothetical protein|uniref:Uncharacterized protein n=1 Tax=Panicum hallii TaxID=206008 RepID=A0A2T8KJH9_9POAL|nr:hypothetical protein PAHAL_3G266900 [Panicum hallii]
MIILPLPLSLLSWIFFFQIESPTPPTRAAPLQPPATRSRRASAAPLPLRQPVPGSRGVGQSAAHGAASVRGACPRRRTERRPSTAVTRHALVRGARGGASPRRRTKLRRGVRQSAAHGMTPVHVACPRRRTELRPSVALAAARRVRPSALHGAAPRGAPRRQQPLVVGRQDSLLVDRPVCARSQSRRCKWIFHDA